jgi:DNA-binding NarL/FixJ family response regulator
MKNTVSTYTHWMGIQFMNGGESQTSSSLSERELQIVELVAAGLTNQEIAEKLEISKRTVDNHISNILTKTATGNRVALVRWALQWGKVCIDEVNCCTLPLPDPTASSNPSQPSP